MVMVRPSDTGRSAAVGEQSRARYPDESGYVERPDGTRIFWERYGSGQPAIVFVPTWSIVHSRVWKGQIPWFARRHRVIAFDAPGNGRSDRPQDAAAYDERLMAEDIIRVMDATATPRAVFVSLSLGAQRSLIAADRWPERVVGVVFIGPSMPMGEPLAERRGFSFEDDLPTDEGWAKYNIHYWRRDFAGFLQFFFGQAFSEAHSTKQIEDSVQWGLETDPETLYATEHGRDFMMDEALDMAFRIRCPTLVIQGDDDGITGPSRGIALADAIPGARLEMIAGGGHINEARDPVRVNLLLRDFVDGLEPAP
jgi:pimeloyl-ACP methyl ester carboxylesterase